MAYYTIRLEGQKNDVRIPMTRLTAPQFTYYGTATSVLNFCRPDRPLSKDTAITDRKWVS